PLPSASFLSWSFALLWSSTMCWPNFLTSSLAAFSAANLLRSTSIFPPLAAFLTEVRAFSLSLGSSAARAAGMKASAMDVGLATRLIPAEADFDQRRIIAFEAPVARNVQLVLGIRQQINRRADGDVRLHRRIQRKQRVFRRLFQGRALILDPAIQDRPAIFC